MKTLAEAYQQFDLTRLIEEQLVGHPQAINAYVECCERYVGKIKQRLSGKEKTGRQSTIRSNNLLNFLENLLTSLKHKEFKLEIVLQDFYQERLSY
ncbi:hypothetical protein ACIN5032_2223 [Acinetobacter baumannii OIFC032]|nr:hypothetical protein ACIN5032_2223 [Acinetobacter baumannii OIFC032]